MGLWGGIVPDNAANPAELHAMLDAGVLGFKSFMIQSGTPDQDHLSAAIRGPLPTPTGPPAIRCMMHHLLYLHVNPNPEH